MAITYREAGVSDAEAMDGARAAGRWDGGASALMMARYLAGEHHPQQARPPRVAFLAEDGGAVVGFVAGHLTRRFGCDGELQWIFVDPAHRGGELAAGLLRRLAGWFVAQGARRVCVNVAPENARARAFYTRHGARELSDYWLEWPVMSVALASGAPGDALQPTGDRRRLASPASCMLARRSTRALGANTHQEHPVIPDLPGAVPEIPVSDVAAAAEYYRNKLRFSVDWLEADIALAGVSRDQCRLFLAGPVFREQRGNASPVSTWLNLRSKDEVDALHRAWRSTNAILLSDPESKPWGLHEFTAADPDGNRLRVFYDFATPEREHAGSPAP